MSKPIIVGYDPRPPIAPRSTSASRRALHRRVAHRRLGRARGGWPARRREQDEDLVVDPSDALASAQRELEPEDRGRVPRATGERAPRERCTRPPRPRTPACSSSGRPRQGAIGRVLPGSTAERLMHGAPCPIAIVPPGWEAGGGLRTIGVAYVDTEEGREALRSAHALAGRAGATLRVLTAVKGRARHVRGDRGAHRRAARQGLRRGRGRVARARRGCARRATDGARRRRPGGDRRLRRGSRRRPHPWSEHLDLLVCGSRGYGPLRAVLLGAASRAA